ncbi:MAG: molybdenum ABC transporter ATP-binding protein, partial [Gammaproteobacteria bacterium]|nr:molybdenum ABC transporter ATP-binding protein [Gammaproteobacteria bacterium]
DQVWQDTDNKLFLPVHKRAIGYVFQDTELFTHLNVHNNLLYGYRRLAVEQQKIKPETVIELLGLGQLLARSTLNLSGGEKQRVAIGRALLTSPQLLLMDEPLAALDTQSKSEIMPYLEQLHTELKLPVLYVSHSLDEVARLADEIILMSQGQVKARGEVHDIFTRLDLAPAHDTEASSIIDANVIAHEEEYSLSILGFDGGQITLASQGLKIGQKVRVIIHAKDVSLALEHHTNSSILNIMSAKVLEIGELTRSKVLIKLDVGGQALLSSITKKSSALLNIHPGQNVFVQIKSVALL